MLLALAFLAPLVLMAPLITTGLPFLDDNNLGATHNERGLAGPSRALSEISAYYRPLATLLLSIVYLVPDHLAWARWLGVALHGAAVVAILAMWRRVGGGVTGAAILLAGFGLYLYSPEAIGWPAALVAYPLALTIVAVGAWLLLAADGARRLAVGAAVCTTALLAQEQVLPLVGVALLATILTRRNSLLPVLLGALPPLALFATSIVASAGKAARFSGENGASLSNLTTNLDFASEYARALPGGSLWESTAGVGGWRLMLAGALGVALAALWLVRGEGPPGDQPRSSGSGWGAPYSRAQHPAVLPVSAVVGGLACAAASVSALLLSPLPYVTPRLLYFPMLGLTIAAAGIVEAARRMTPQSGVVPAVFALPLMAFAGFSATALSAEAAAYREQLEVNREQLDALVAEVSLRDVVRDDQRLVVAGFEPTAVERPLFGEHIFGLNTGDVGLAATRQGLTQDGIYRVLDFRSGLIGLCLQDGGGFGLLQEWRANAPQRWEGVDVHERTVFAVWNGARWEFQRPGERSALAGELVALGLPACTTA